MATFCKKHAIEFIGTRNSFPELSQAEYDLLLTAWTDETFICEECGYDYLKQKQRID